MLLTVLPGLLMAYLIADVLGAFDDEPSETEDDGTPVTVTSVSPDGAEIYLGGTGDDVIRAGIGDDQVRGEDGDDTLFGENGNDIVFGGPGDDHVFLGDGNDTSNVDSAGDDLIRGGSGDDQIRDTSGSDTLFGDLGNDRLDAVDDPSAPGGDTLIGGFGADTLAGDTADTFSGGRGVDTFDVTELDVTDSAARITDAEPGEVIRVTVAEAAAGEGLTTRLAGNGTDLEVLFRDDLLVILEGITSPGTVSLELAPNVIT